MGMTWRNWKSSSEELMSTRCRTWELCFDMPSTSPEGFGPLLKLMATGCWIGNATLCHPLQFMLDMLRVNITVLLAILVQTIWRPQIHKSTSVDLGQRKGRIRCREISRMSKVLRLRLDLGQVVIKRIGSCLDRFGHLGT
jgi:hypothetical protein